MKFSPTKDIAEKWGISPRRVALLASSGRIEGAVFTGNAWLIPEDAKKPADSRRKETRNQEVKSDTDKYPYLICVVNSEEKFNSLAFEEKMLFNANQMHEAGEFNNARSIAESLLSTNNLNVRIGALYLLCFGYLYQSDFTSAEKYSALFLEEYKKIDNPSLNIRILFDSYSAEACNNKEFMESTLVNLDYSSCTPDYIPLLISLKLYSELIKYTTDKGNSNTPDLSLYEAICNLSEEQGYSFVAMYMHVVLSLFKAVLKDDKSEYFHMQKAVRLCVEHKYYFTFSSIVATCFDTCEKVLEDYPEEVRNRINEFVKIFMDARIGLSVYRHSHSLLCNLNEEDYRLISFCLRNYTVTEIAEAFGLSRSGANRRIAALYEKMGVSSRKEMKKLYSDFILD